MKFLKTTTILLLLMSIAQQLFSQSQVVTLLKSEWILKQKNKEGLYRATVPGCVHTDLLNDKAIPDPYYRINEKDLQWIDKNNWIYQTSFSVSKDIISRKNIYLNFKGLDTYAKVFLNNVEVLNANNMFREWTVDCKKLLKEEGNTLTIEFESPINKTIPLFDSLSFHYPAPNDQSLNGEIGDKKVSIFTRKAGYQYGWDWGPRFVTSGIWRPIYIIAFDNIRQTDFSVNTKSISKESAELSASVELQSYEPVDAEVEFWVNNQFHSSSKATFGKGISSNNFTLTIQSPKLWWCNGLGEPYLYTIKCLIKKNGILLDEKEIRVGIRTITLVHEKDSIGKSFYFKLNGVPIFMKGANYIPLDNFPSRVTTERYEKTIQSAVDANMNMLRVWGGGIYENDIFYDLCDEKGILLWQDFMFACSLYPGDDAFLENIKQEVIDNVKRLRNHPSIALWCGNNEINTAWNGWGWKAEMEKNSPQLVKTLSNDYDKLFNKLIPALIHKYDSLRFYWPSSPMASKDKKAGDLNSGDIHYWDVWHFGKPFKEYENNIGRFMSEYGFQSFPDIKTVEEYTIPNDRNIESTVMTAHQRHPRGNELIKTYLGYYYKMPKDFDNFLYVGQVLQAEGIKLAIEAHRRARPRCMGTLYWQLNDCWPVASWSSTDYYGRWKALHYFVKKAYSPVLISQKLSENKAEVSFISDLLENKPVTAEFKIIDFDGNILWKQEKNITIKANTNTKLSIDFASANITEALKQNTMLIISVPDDKTIPPSYVYFKDSKDLQLPKPALSLTIAPADNGFAITIKTDKLAKNVYLQSEKKGFLDDNFFDLLPGETKTIKFRTQTKSLDNNNFKIRSLIDSF